MSAVKPVHRLTLPERVNFLLTNRLPRRWLTLFVGRLSRVQNPLVRALSMTVWRAFVDDLRLGEAKKQRFSSMHDCFTRELADGARPVDQRSQIVVSPCDAVIGQFGSADGLEVIQAKGFPYTIDDLLGSRNAAESVRDGRFVTLRLKSSMYHRFHAPADARIRGITYIAGDTWNVNPIALRAVERLFCKNERAVLPMQTAGGSTLVLVAVGAILVASIRIHGLPEALNLEYSGPERIPFARGYRKGEEIGYFEHGSTIVMFVPPHFDFVAGVETGTVIRMGQPLLADTVTQGTLD